MWSNLVRAQNRSVRTSLAVCVLAISTGYGSARAETVQKGVLGLGFILGEPSGLSGKYYISDQAIDFAFGYSPFRSGLSIHSDYLWHPWILESRSTFVLPAYVGLGMRVLKHNGDGTDDHYRVGVRTVIGMAFDFARVPLDAFLEIAPVIDYKTEGEVIEFDINASAGCRYYF